MQSNVKYHAVFETNKTFDGPLQWLGWWRGILQRKRKGKFTIQEIEKDSYYGDQLGANTSFSIFSHIPSQKASTIYHLRRWVTPLVGVWRLFTCDCLLRWLNNQLGTETSIDVDVQLDQRNSTKRTTSFSIKQKWKRNWKWESTTARNWGASCSTWPTFWLLERSLAPRVDWFGRTCPSPCMCNANPLFKSFWFQIFKNTAQTGHLR